VVFIFFQSYYSMNRIFGQLGRYGYGMHIQIDKNAPVPLYRQTIAKVRRLIDAGLLATDTRLPTIPKITPTLTPMTITKLCISFSGS